MKFPRYGKIKVMFQTTNQFKTTLRPSNNSQSCSAGRPSWTPWMCRDNFGFRRGSGGWCRLLLTQAKGKTYWGRTRVRIHLKLTCRTGDLLQSQRPRTIAVLGSCGTFYMIPLGENLKRMLHITTVWGLPAENESKSIEPQLNLISVLSQFNIYILFIIFRNHPRIWLPLTGICLRF